VRPRQWERPPDDDVPGWIVELRERAHDLAQRLALSQVENARLRRELLRRDAEIARVVSHTVIVLALVGAYVAVTLHGDDGTLLLGLLGGYIGGAAVEKASQYRARP
jgi:hypothetical protein